MIGVIPKPGQSQVVEEFFELFKTPWEPYRPGTLYDVLIAADHQTPEVEAKLVLVFGSEEMAIDRRLGICPGTRLKAQTVTCGASAVPIYGSLLTFAAETAGTPCVKAASANVGVRLEHTHGAVIRLGYDLFAEVEFLLSKGQPVDHADSPTLDLHIKILRQWILEAGIPILEIRPVPAGYDFMTCLTHDIDFVGIRRHFFDHSMLGFVWRATVGSSVKFLKRRMAFSTLCKNWLATASLPFVYAGWAKDFWEPFEWYLKAEKGLPVTYFLIPFKGRAGEKITAANPSRRAVAYDVSDLSETISILLDHGCELGVHGIDAWHSPDKGREELLRVSAVTGKSEIGIRMHWLLNDEKTPAALEEAGYGYDSTCGYNEAVGYRAGTGQAFRPLGRGNLLEIPLHIQDGALFYPKRLGLSEAEAHERCQALIKNAREFGGVLTLLWHDRSHGPERFWGGFYVKLIDGLKAGGVWFGTASQVAAWFRKRRNVRFASPLESAPGTGIRIQYDGEEIQPPLTIRVYQSPKQDNSADGSTFEFNDVSWNGKSAISLDELAETGRLHDFAY